MAIDHWMPTLRTNLATVTGISQAHTYLDLPGSIQTFPTLLIVPVSGTQPGGVSAPGIALHNVQVTLYVANQIIPEALGAAVPFIELIRNEIYAHVTLSSNCSYCLPASDGLFYEGPGAIVYGDKTLCGIVFHLTVKETEALTVAA
jgi:hypothetical protein